MHLQGGIQKKTEVGKTYKAGDIWEEDKKKVTLYAQWSATEYEVIYDANGGQVAPDRKNIVYDGEYGSLPTPTKEGHTFKGWFTEITGGEQITSNKKYTTVGNQTIYAHWEIKTYQVTYNANNGTGEPGAQTKTWGQTLQLSSIKPTRNGHTFVSWNTKADGTGTNYNPGANYTENAGIILYAKWQAITYQVTYNANANGVTGTPGAQTKTWGQTLQLNSTKPTRSGYTFVNWNTQANGGGTSYNPGANYTANAGVTLYAQWKQDGVLATTAITPSTYGNSVNYSANGVTDWKVFLNDGTNIYIIASEYLPRSKMTLDSRVSAGAGDYCVKGSSRDNLLNWLKDTTKWTAYANGTSGLTGTVTGGPTLEQFWLSYNNKYNTSYANEQWLSSHTGYSNTLYFPHTAGWNSCSGYWLASPDASDAIYVWRVYCYGRVSTISYNDTDYRGPSVSLSAIWYLRE